MWSRPSSWYRAGTSSRAVGIIHAPPRSGISAVYLLQLLLARFARAQEKEATAQRHPTQPRETGIILGVFGKRKIIGIALNGHRLGKRDGIPKGRDSGQNEAGRLKTYSFDLPGVPGGHPGPKTSKIQVFGPATSATPPRSIGPSPKGRSAALPLGLKQYLISQDVPEYARPLAGGVSNNERAL